MPYAIVQVRAEPPTVGQLARAFRALPELTAGDAATMARDAYGIIVRGRSLDSARALRAALAQEGVEALIVDQARLPKVPPGQRLLRAAVREEGLVAADLHGRERTVAWEHVLLVAAGAIRTTEASRRVTRHVDVHVHPSHHGAGTTVVSWRVETEHRESVSLLLHMVLDVEPARYAVEGTRFNYDYLGPRRTGGKPQDYLLLAADVLAHTGHASRTIGAKALEDGRGATCEYPSRDTFEEEITWLLWQRLGRPGVVD